MDIVLLEIIKNFHNNGTLFIKGKRNTIKLFNYNELIINIKSFKKPNYIKGFIYNFFRKSKAKRSFIYANLLLKLEIKTPKPIAFYENKNLLFLKDSYFICEHIKFDLLFRDIIEKPFDDTENVLKQLAFFCFQMHEKGIEFLDHSPGNTLIVKNSSNKYDFYLVDLNRMKFHKQMNLNLRMKNLSRLIPSKNYVKIFSAEYAKFYNKNENIVFDLMWNYSEKYFSKKNIFQKIKFIVKN